MSIQILGKYLVVAGTIIIFLGILFLSADKFMVGKLFGDLNIKSGDTEFIIPIATIILISITVTLIINFFRS